MEKITNLGSFHVPKKTVGYVFATEAEMSEYVLEDGQLMIDLGIKAGDALLLWYKHPYDHDDDFDVFKVYEGEKVYRIEANKNPRNCGGNY